MTPGGDMSLLENTLFSQFQELITTTGQITERCSNRISEVDCVPGAGLEPARGCPQGIFVPLQLSLLHASITCICGLDFTFAIPGAAQVHTD